MSSSKHTRIPNKPILSSTTTKVVSGKVVKTGSHATTPQRPKPKKLIQQKEVAAIHPITKNEKKEKTKSISGSETDSEIPRISRNSNQNSFSSTQSNKSNQSTPKRDSLESLKKQINDLSKFSFQQSQLIKKLHADLVRAELVTGNSDPNVQDILNPEQFSLIGQRLHYLLENYIDQSERLKKIGGIDQAEKQFNEYSERDADNFDIELGQKIRSLYDEGSTNEDIIAHVESLNYFADSMKTITKIEDSDINSHIKFLKNRIRESEELKSTNEEVQRENDNLTHLLKDTQDKLLQSTSNNDANQQILNTIKSFYQDSSNINQLIEQDLELSNKVRNIFDDDDNNEAILRTIQSNKETADDNARVAELSSKLQQLQHGDAPGSPQKESEAIENLNKQHQQELAEKDSEIIQLKQENSYFRHQLTNQSSSIQNLNSEIENNQQKLAEKDAQITNLTQENEQLRNSIQSQEIHKQELAQKDSEIIQLKQENIYLKNQQQKQSHSLQTLNEAVESSQKEITEKDSQILRLTKLVEDLEAKGGNESAAEEGIMQKQQQEIAQRDSQIIQLTQENRYLKGQAQNQLNSIQSLKQEVESSNQKLADQDSQISSLTQENERLKNEANNTQNLSETIQSHQQKLAEKDSQITSLTQENERLKNEANNAQNLSETIQSHQQKLAEKDSQITSLTQENERLKNEANNAQSLTETIQSHQQKLAEKDSQITSLTQENERLRNEANNAQNLTETIQSHQQKLAEKDSQITSLTQENERLKSESNRAENLASKIERDEQKIAERDSQITQLTQENDYLRNQGQTQANSIRDLHLTIDDFQRQVSQKQEELNEAYRRLEQEGKENEEQRKDRELSTKVREVFNSCPEDSIITFIKKDVELSSSIRYIYQSGDDPYIITKIRGEHHENEQILAENSHLTEENSQLRTQISEKNKINEQREKENDELRSVINNFDNVKNKEIEYLKKELLTSLDKQKELENKMVSKDNENDKLKNQISRSIESKENHENLMKERLDKLKYQIEQKENEIKNLKILYENEINKIKNDQQNNKNVDLFHSVTNLFHPDLSNDQIKDHSQKLAQSAESFYNDADTKDALNHLFGQASAENLHILVEQMKNDPDESVRKNAEVLSDVLKDSRMSVEAEGMITATLAIFLQQMSNNQ